MATQLSVTKQLIEQMLAKRAARTPSLAIYTANSRRGLREASVCIIGSDTTADLGPALETTEIQYEPPTTGGTGGA